jgi:type III secretory pathway component EscR
LRGFARVHAVFHKKFTTQFTTQLLHSNFIFRYIDRTRYNNSINFIELYYTQLRVFLNTNMKQELYKTILNKFKNNGKVLFFKNKFYFNGLNNFDDLLIKGNLKTKKPQAISILFRNKQPEELNDNKKDIINLVQKNENLTNVGAITSIFLEKQTIKDIQRVIKKSNSTYLRIFNNEKSIQISIFDYRQFIPRTRLLRQKSFQYYNLPTSEEQVEKFSKTIKADSFLMLPNIDLWLRINQNSIITFTDEDTETKYLIREQDINEPVCNFVNPKINKSITFVFTNLSEKNINNEIENAI